MILSEVSQAVFTRRRAKCRLNAVTTRTGVGSYSMWINRSVETVYDVTGSFSTSKNIRDFQALNAKLRKATISFVMSVRLYVRMEQIGSHWTDIYEI